MNDELKRAYIIGWPVKHSRSPMIHGFWLNQHALSGSYELAEIMPADLPKSIEKLREAGFAGANVTVPHKEAMVQLCDVVSKRAQNVGAVNTIWLRNGILRGDNTDVHGFCQNLTDYAPAWKTGKTAVILGAGGAARAILFGLIAQGYATVYLANRNLARAQNLAALWPGRVVPISWEEAPILLAKTDLLVQTTSLGMRSEPPLQFDLSHAKPGLIVNDIVYVPLETDLLKNARSRGLICVDGLGMLLHQAVPGFEQWFGKRPEVTGELRELIVKDIEK